MRAVLLYRLALFLLPPAVRKADGEEMSQAFSDLWNEEMGAPTRLRVALTVFGRLPAVALVEWIDHLRSAPGSGPKRKPRRWGMSSWLRNLQYALRTLTKTPAFALTTVLLVGLGVGSVTTIFTLVDHIILRSLPYPSQDRLFVLENGSHSGPMVREFQEMASVERWGFVLSETANLVGEGDPLRLTRTEVSRDFFSLFGARPALGRLLVDEDFTNLDVVVLSHGLWQRAFGSDPGVVGHTVRINDLPFTVVGVLDREFLAPEVWFSGESGRDVWLPLNWMRPELEGLGYHNIEAAGALAPGASLSDVEAEVDRALERLAERYPEQFLDDEGNLQYDTPPAALQEVTIRRVRAGLNLLFGAVGLVLLVACMNVAHLFLARSLGRVQEMAVRRALGADTPGLVQQLLVESLVLGAGGGFLGLGLAALGLRTFTALNPSALPSAGRLDMDLRVLLFTGLLSAVTVILFGLLPALRSVGKDLTNDLKGVSRASTSGRGASRVRGGLVVAEVAFSLVLVTGAALLLKSFLRVQARDPGFQSAGVWTIPLTPSWIDSPDEYREAMGRVEASLASLPGVTDASYSLTLPMERTGRGRCCWITSRMTVEGVEREGVRLLLQPVTEGYFTTLGIPLLAGRVWRESEVTIEPWTVVISEVLAVELFGSAEAALGRTLTAGGDGTPVQVLGVAGDTHHFGLDQDPPFFIYLPMEHLPWGIPRAHMAVKIGGDAPSGWVRTLREAVWEEVPDMPVPTVRAMEEWIRRSTASRRFDSALFGAFGAVALILAAAGLYGTLLYGVGQRRRELGIRLALGAGRKSVEREVVASGLALAAVGSVIGLGGSWAAGRFLESRLHNLAPTDPATLLTAVLVLLFVAAVASWLPARRAGKTDPLETLKAE